MSLAPGVRLGPYEILAAIGAGGMGQDVSADGQRFLVNLLSDENQFPMTLVLNWRTMLSRTP